MAARMSGETRRRVKRSLLRRYGPKCFYCERNGSVTIDHFVPVSKGGTNAVKNLRPACAECNERKADLLPKQLKIVKMNRFKQLGFRTGNQCGNLFCCE